MDPLPWCPRSVAMGLPHVLDELPSGGCLFCTPIVAWDAASFVTFQGLGEEADASGADEEAEDDEDDPHEDRAADE